MSQAERRLISAIAEVIEPISQAVVSVRIADLSLNGCYAGSLTVFPTGTSVKLSIRHSSRHFVASAKVVQGKTGMGMGLRFENLSDRMHSILGEWLSTSNGEIATPIEYSSTEPKDLKTPHRKVKLSLMSLIKFMMQKGQLTGLEGRGVLEQLRQDC